MVHLPSYLEKAHCILSIQLEKQDTDFKGREHKVKREDSYLQMTVQLTQEWKKMGIK